MKEKGCPEPKPLLKPPFPSSLNCTRVLSLLREEAGMVVLPLDRAKDADRRLFCNDTHGKNHILKRPLPKCAPSSPYLYCPFLPLVSFFMICSFPVMTFPSALDIKAMEGFDRRDRVDSQSQMVPSMGAFYRPFIINKKCSFQKKKGERKS